MDSILGLYLRSGWRHVLGRPALSMLIGCTLAMGLGAVICFFAIARGVLLRPLPYSSQHELSMIWRTPKDRPSRMTGFRDEHTVSRQIATPAHVRLWKLNPLLSDLAAVELWLDSPAVQFDLVSGASAVRLRGARASANIFDLLGVKAELGTTFNKNTEELVAVLSHDLWTSAFGADPSIVGRAITLLGGRDRQPRLFTVIGVLPRSFRFSYPQGTQIWTPIPESEMSTPSPRDVALLYRAVARVRPNTSAADAEERLNEMQRVGGSLLADDAVRFRVRLESIGDYSLGRARAQVSLLAIITAFVLVATCLSVSALIAAQTTQRKAELAIHRALGASTNGILLRLSIETIMMTTIGAAAALASVALLTPAIRAALPPTVPRADEVALDAMTMLMAPVMILLIAGMVGLAPLWRAATTEWRLTAFSQSTATAGPTAARLRWWLIAGQGAAAYLLLAGGALLLQEFWNLQRVDLGFASDKVVTVSLRLLNEEYREPARRRLFHERLTAGLRAIPGVVDVGLSSAIPFFGVDTMSMARLADSKNGVLANERHVDDGYFRVMRIGLLAGRLISPNDIENGPRIAVVSESLAKALSPHGSALGKTLLLKGPVEIVGIVADIRARRHDQEPNPAYYLPRTQAESDRVAAVFSVEPHSAAIKDAVQNVLHSIDQRQPIEQITVLSEIVAESLADRRFYAVVTMSFGLLTLFVSSAGLCGVLFQTVSQQVREIGIRAVLGATPFQQVCWTLSLGLRPLLCGAGVGLFVAWAAGRMFRGASQTAGHTATAFATVMAAVVIVGLLAALLPALRAARMRVVDSLRSA